MAITDILAGAGVIAAFPAGDKALLRDLSQRAARALTIDSKVILDALRAREALGSTGIGAGIAIPHARIPGLSRFFGLFVRLERGINFEAVDSQPVDLVFLLLSPDREDNGQLAALACISRLLRDRDNAARFRAARSVGEIRRILLRNGSIDC